jgi:hypothetical protein
MPQRFRFSSGDDVALLQQIRKEVPFAAAVAGDGDKGWQRVAHGLRELGLQVETRTVRDRFFLLYRKYLDGNLGGLRRGSSDADFQQKEVLLQQIAEIVRRVDISLEAKLRRKSYDPSRMSGMLRSEDDGDLEIEPDQTSSSSENNMETHASFVMSMPAHSSSMLANQTDMSLVLPMSSANGSGSSADSQSNKRQRTRKDSNAAETITSNTQEAILQVLMSLETQKREELQLRERELAQAEAKLAVEREALALAQEREARAIAAETARDAQMKQQLELLQELVSRKNQES